MHTTSPPPLMLPAAWSLPRGRRTRARARAAGSAGRRCAARGGGEGPGRPATAGRGLGGAARARLLARARCPALARTPCPAAAGALRQEGRRALATPPARRAPGGPPSKTQTQRDPRGPRSSRTPERADRRAPPGSLFPQSLKQPGREAAAPPGRGEMGRVCEPPVAYWFSTEGRQERTGELVAFPIHPEFQVSVGQVLAEISDPLPSKFH